MRTMNGELKAMANDTTAGREIIIGSSRTMIIEGGSIHVFASTEAGQEWCREAGIMLPEFSSEDDGETS